MLQGDTYSKEAIVPSSATPYELTGTNHIQTITGIYAEDEVERPEVEDNFKEAVLSGQNRANTPMNSETVTVCTDL